MVNEIIKEVCIDDSMDVESLISKQNEFHRFETCSNLNEGGLTPKKKFYKKLCKLFENKEQVIMIRPSNSFYIKNEKELNKIFSSIKKFVKLGAKHFIFGYLIKENDIDIISCKKIINLISSYENTSWSFHMAIDLVNDYDKSFKELMDLGFTRVLTKGGKTEAINNINTLKELNAKYGSQIEILVGGKVTKDNYQEIHNKTNINQFHGTKIV